MSGLPRLASDASGLGRAACVMFHCFLVLGCGPTSRDEQKGSQGFTRIQGGTPEHAWLLEASVAENRATLSVPGFAPVPLGWLLRTPDRVITTGGTLRMTRATADGGRMTLAFRTAESPLELSLVWTPDALGFRVEASLSNLGKSPIRLVQVDVLGFPAGFGGTERDWRMLIDTGANTWSGVRRLDRPMESNLVTVLASPASNRSVLLGFLSTSRCDGWISLRPDTAGAGIRSLQVPCRNPGVLAPGAVWRADPLRLAAGPDPLELLESYAEEVETTGGRPLPREPLAGFLTWYAHRTAVTEAGVVADARFIAGLLDGYPQPLRRVFLLDHGWTPRASWGAWSRADPHRFPHGLDWLGKELRLHGLELGLWSAPFCFTEDCDDVQTLLPWTCVQDGAPLGIRPAVWPGEGDRMALILDPSLSEVRRRFTEEFASMNAWGPTLFKVDFFRVRAGDARAEEWPDVRIASEVFKSIREGIGAQASLLLATAPTNLCLGHCEYMTVAPDVGPAGTWPASLGEFRTIFTTVAANWYKHGTFWVNDHQSIHVAGGSREGEARIRAGLVSFSGSGFWVGEAPGEIPPQRLRLLQRCLPVYGRAATPLDLFTVAGPEEVPGVWQLTVDSDWQSENQVVALFNLSEQSITRRVDPTWWGLSPGRSAHVLEWWSGRWLEPEAGSFQVDIPPLDMIVLHAAADRDHPWVVSTDAHYAPGWILSGVAWDESTRTLRGDILTKPGLLVAVLGFAPPGWRPQDGQASVQDDGGGRWRLTLRTTGPKTPFSVKFRGMS